MKMKWILLLGLMLVPVCIAADKKPVEPGVALTIYNENFAVVKERRQMEFAAGQNVVKFTDVASQIDPTSVLFECLDYPGQVKLLEQNYEYDLVNTQGLLKKYIDKSVSIQVKGSGSSGSSLVSGVLLSADGVNLILQDDEGKMNVIGNDSVQRIQLDKKPENLLTRPTLVWMVDAAKKLAGLCQVAYTTEGIGWKADYTAVLNDKDDALDLNGWVTITNNSGAAYEDAALKLIAGDVKRVAPQQPRQPMYDRMMVAKAVAVAGEGFEEKSFMEYHLYTLGRKTTLQNNQVKQIELIEPALNVPAKKIFVYEVSLWDRPGRDRNKVQVKMEFENKKENHLGIALPKGRVRVFKKDPADASLEFVGEDQIDHTPKDEKLSLYIGDAFDIVAEQTMTDSRNGDRWQTFTRKVELRNRKDEAVILFVEENIPTGRNWKIDDTKFKYEKKDAYTCRFAIEVGANAVVPLVYQMTQTW